MFKDIITGPLVTVEDLARELGYSYKELSRIVYKNQSHRYKLFILKKKSGGERVIATPKKTLKSIQQKIASELVKVYPGHQSCHGFCKERSIVTNAIPHKNKRFVFNIDLSDFFGSIHFGRVKNLFLCPPFNLSHEVSTVIAHICCFNNALPQGAPTSPVISNMICLKLDAQLKHLARENRCTYTRYADDITFSFNCRERKLPTTIVNREKDESVYVGEVLKSIISANGFNINQSKVRLQKYNQRQMVTGLVVNSKNVNVRRSFLNKTKSMIYAAKKFGLANAELEYVTKYHDKTLSDYHREKIKDSPGHFFKRVISGRLYFIKMVRGEEDRVYRNLRFKFSEIIGKPEHHLLLTKEEELAKSVFIIEDGITSQGTAFYLKGVGLITNQHVLGSTDPDDAYLFKLKTSSEHEIKTHLDLIKADASKDLAVVYANKEVSEFEPLPIGESKYLNLGDEVLLIGYPEYSEGESPHISRCKIAQRANIHGNDVYLVDASVFHGHSGGPVLNTKYQVIGIVTYGTDPNSPNRKYNGFIPIDKLTDFTGTANYKNRLDFLELKNSDKYYNKNIIASNQKKYCRNCYEKKKMATEVISIGQSFNCKFCMRVYEIK